MLQKVVNNNEKIFICEKCDYKCFRKYDYEKHLLTDKHLSEKCLNKVVEYNCECGKKYKHKQSLHRHKLKCNFENKENKIVLQEETSIIDNSNTELKDLVCKLITENNEIRNSIIKENEQLREQVKELIPKVGNNNNNINQKFNIQVFLNNHCKDAINMADFIKSIEISIDQLNFTKQKGLAEGLSNAIIENMNKLSLYERPLHCSDLKREILYIKDENEWSKDENNCKLKKAIRKASSKNYNALQKWKANNPDFIENDNKQQEFSKIISEIGKSGDNIDNKIIKNICKETYIKDNI